MPYLISEPLDIPRLQQILDGLQAEIDERERANRENADRAETARREAEALLAEHLALLAGAAADVDQLIAEGRAQGQQIAARIQREAAAAATAMSERAREEIERERQKAVSDLRAVAADAAVKLAGRILEVELDPKRHEKLAEKTLTDLPPH